MIAHLRPLALLLAAAWVMSCGYSEAGHARPDADVGPVSALTLSFRNGTTLPLYIDWSGREAHFEVSRDGTILITEHACLSPCEQACSCADCGSTTTAIARKLAAGGVLTLTWDPVHYEESSCGGDPSCRCLESWPLTAGRYRLAMAASYSVSSGQTDPSDPALLIGAQLPSTAAPCLAVAQFDLAGGATVEASFVCQP